MSGFIGCVTYVPGARNRRLGFRRAPDRDFEPVRGVGLWAFVLAL